MIAYEPFPIANFRTGFAEAVEPWLLPKDAFQVMKNAHLYRGVVEKVNGYRLYAHMTYRVQHPMSGAIDGGNTTYTYTIAEPLASNYVYVQANTATGLESFSYSSFTLDPITNLPITMNLVSNLGGTGTVTLSTGATTVTFFNAPTLDSGYNTVIIEFDVIIGTSAIMGIKPYYRLDGTQDVIVFNQNIVGVVKPLFDAMIITQECPNVVIEVPHAVYLPSAFISGDLTTWTGTIGVMFPGTLTIQQYTLPGVPVGLPITDNGAGGLIGPTISSGQVNYSTGQITFTLINPAGATDYFDAVKGISASDGISVVLPPFSGGINNFFDLCNYLAIAPFSNFKDRPMYYSEIAPSFNINYSNVPVVGGMINFLPTNFTVKKVTTTITGVPDYDILRVLHVATYNQRIILLNIQLSATFNLALQPNYAYWSQPFKPLDYKNQIAAITIGNNLPAPTSESIRLFGLINTDMVVRFNNSERIFRYTGDTFSPFRWDQTNNIFACDTNYSDINYDTYYTSVGKPAIVGSDGVNVKRVDEIIPDFTDPTRISDQDSVPFINQTNIDMCFGERFDDLKEGWMCYRSAEGTFPQPSDNVLSFNYLDKTYAIYTFEFSCLGLGIVINNPTWGTIPTVWDDMDDTWGDYTFTATSLADLAGDHDNEVFELNTGSAMGDGVTPILFDIITKNFNPYSDEGQLVRFGYVDFFFSSDTNATVRIQFYKDDQFYVDGNGDPAGFYQETALVLNPTTSNNTLSSSKVWKRIYVGALGKEHTMRIYQNPLDFVEASIAQDVRIHAIVPYFKAAGRIFN